MTDDLTLWIVRLCFRLGGTFGPRKKEQTVHLPAVVSPFTVLALWGAGEGEWVRKGGEGNCLREE